MAATSIQYGDDTITRVRTGSASMQPIYDESGTVVVAQAHSIAFAGFVNSGTVSGFADAINGLHARLSIPRQRLRIYLGSETWKDIQPARSGESSGDVGNGPQITGLDVREIHGGRAAFVAGTAEWTEPVGEAAPTILAHRYTVRSEIDQAQGGRELRTVSGTLRLSGRLADANPDLFRNHVWPVESVGYQRVRAEFVVSSDGLELAYTVTDREGYRPLPDGILEANAQQVISVREPDVASGDVGSIEVLVQGTMTGSRLISPQKLMDGAMAVLNARLLTQVTSTDDTMIVREITFAEDVFGPRTLQFIARGERAMDRRDGKVLRLSRYGLFNSIATGTHGTAGRFHQISAYGSSLVYAAYQAIFDQTTDGNPLSSATFATRADTERFSQEDFADTDGDGIKDSLVADWDAGDLEAPVPILAVEASDPDADQVVTGAFSSATDVQSEAQAGAHPYFRARQSVHRQIVNHTIVIPTADPDSADIVQQLRAPTVIEVWSGELERLADVPDIPTPPQLTGTTSDYIVREAKIEPAARVQGIDGRLIYQAKYMYVLERIYNPDATAGTWTQRSATIAGTARTLTEYSLPIGAGEALPQSVVLDAGTEVVQISGAGRLV